MPTYNQQMQDIFRRYQEEVSSQPVDLRVVGAWAMANGLWQPRAIDMQTRFATEMAEALREEYRTDNQGRRYRSKLAVTISQGGRQGSLWGDIDTAPRSHVVRNVAQRRRQSAYDLFQIQVDVDHFNATHRHEEQLELSLDFTDDVAEMKVAAGIANAA